MAKNRKGSSRALAIVQKWAPGIKEVRDATDDIDVQITKADVSKARKADHSGCAVAVAGTRACHADGMLVSITTCYVLKGTVAYRYKIPECISREITSFDRGAAFAPGEYFLKAPSESIALGSPRQARGGHTREYKGTGAKPARHLTEDIRAVLVGNKNRRSA